MGNTVCFRSQVCTGTGTVWHFYTRAKTVPVTTGIRVYGVWHLSQVTSSPSPNPPLPPAAASPTPLSRFKTRVGGGLSLHSLPPLRCFDKGKSSITLKNNYWHSLSDCGLVHHHHPPPLFQTRGGVLSLGPHHHPFPPSLQMRVGGGWCTTSPHHHTTLPHHHPSPLASNATEGVDVPRRHITTHPPLLQTRWSATSPHHHPSPLASNATERHITTLPHHHVATSPPISPHFKRNGAPHHHVATSPPIRRYCSCTC